MAYRFELEWSPGWFNRHTEASHPLWLVLIHVSINLWLCPINWLPYIERLTRCLGLSPSECLAELK